MLKLKINRLLCILFKCVYVNKIFYLLAAAAAQKV